MLNRTLTIWELTPVEKFESFLLELVDYLKATLVPVEDPNGQVSYTCTKDLNSDDPDYMEPFERVANFCMDKNLNPHVVIDMIDEYTGDQYNCECYLLEDEKIKKLIQRPR